MRKKWYFFALIFTLFVGSSFTTPKDYKFYTVFVYNFIKYVEWPEKSTDKVIALYTKKPALIEEFVKMAKYKNTAAQKIIIKTFTSLDDLPQAHAIFVPSDKTTDLTLIRKKVTNKHVLIISEGSGNFQYGSNINLVMHKGRLNFEVSKTNLEKDGLQMSSKLMNLALHVE